MTIDVFSPPQVHSRLMPTPNIKEYMKAIGTRFDPTAADGVNAIYQFDLSGDSGGQYHLVVENGTCTAKEGPHPKPSVTFFLSDTDCVGLFNGDLDGPSLYLSGRLRIAGNFDLALRLPAMFPQKR